jgi:hypothetical protein
MIRVKQREIQGCRSLASRMQFSIELRKGIDSAGARCEGLVLSCSIVTRPISYEPKSPPAR